MHGLRPPKGSSVEGSLWVIVRDNERASADILFFALDDKYQAFNFRKSGITMLGMSKCFHM